jgi:hypothetical protein
VTTLFDHQSAISLEDATSNLDSPNNLAGISRLLSANDWQRREGRFDLAHMAGGVEDGNRILWLKKVGRN